MMYQPRNSVAVQVVKNFAFALLLLVVADVFILFTALAQVAIENRTGEWNGFWRWQAEQVIKVLPK